MLNMSSFLLIFCHLIFILIHGFIVLSTSFYFWISLDNSFLFLSMVLCDVSHSLNSDIYSDRLLYESSSVLYLSFMLYLLSI